MKKKSIVSRVTSFGKMTLNKAGIYTKSQVTKNAIAVNPQTFGIGQTGKKEGYLIKPTNVSFATLRALSNYDPVIRICVNTIKKAVSQSNWSIVVKKGSSMKPEEAKEEIRTLTDFFTRPNPDGGENFRVFLDRLMEDILVLDAGVIEKRFNNIGALIGMNVIDGSTVRPRVNKYGEPAPDDKGYAFQQYIDEKAEEGFSKDEIIYIMANPQNDVNKYGYGSSPIESIMLTVQASLEADMHNIKSFSTDNIPPGLLDIGDRTDDEAMQFVALWNATVQANPDMMKFVWGDSGPKKWIPFQSNNRDMQFQEYLDWLSRIKLANYGLTGMDANITQDINRATGEVQADISASRGVKNAKHLVSETFNSDIIYDSFGKSNDKFKDLIFKFDEVTTLKEQLQQSQIDEIKVRSGILEPNEIRERDGLQPLADNDFVPGFNKDPKKEDKTKFFY